MKKKNVFIVATLFLGALLMSSCDNSGHSLNSFRIDIATVQPAGANAYSLLLDNGKHLWPAASQVRFSPRPNQRVFVNYTILTDRHGDFDHLVRVNDIWNILTKNVIELTAENAEKIGDDPVIINQMWAGGDFLNVSFRFNWGGTRPHYINLVKNTLRESDSTDVIELEFRHNAYGSTNSFNRDGFVCFCLRPFQVEGQDEVTFAIRVNTPTGEEVITIVYRYNQLEPEAFDMPIPVITSSEYY